MAVRLKDIARDLGVSVVTVSKVLRGETVERKAIHAAFPHRYSSGVLLVLEQVPDFEVGGRPATIRLRKSPGR